MNQDGDEQPLLKATNRATDSNEVHKEPILFTHVEETDSVGCNLHYGEDRGSSEWITDRGATPLRYAAPMGGLKGAFLRSLPVIFVLSLVAVVVGVYLGYHISPLLQQHTSDRDAFSRGLGELVVFGFLLVLFLTCFSLSVFVLPGSPYETEDAIAEDPAETKAGGGTRVCKWCAVPKPDRTHHCRVCRKCVLKMDHHCPWLANCVGWGNHKYFLLLLVYGMITCLFVGITMIESVIKVIEEPKVDFFELFALMLGMTLDILLFVVLTVFGSFHLYLLTKGMTTIEFCEKRFRRSDIQPPPDMWNLGFWGNFNETFGYNPFLWLLPIDNRRGDGKRFLSAQLDFRQNEGDFERGPSQRQNGDKTSH